MVNAKTIKLNQIDDVKTFVRYAEKCEAKVTVRSYDGYIVDGKSIMGVFSLDLSKPVKVEYDMQVDREFGEFLNNYAI